ncbi:hypothetical protein CCMSSC00406_0004702 [Pleurotus cornucopiae]|uniref:Uncharacterized protein n=1 Tax=Pleurotus cornucopiae TaxID=5321 RepID=A0ACB7J4F0_PLECO|nr:hypothetical protein CCMSSC00406_0004702 [Pleurotus cornucopiae]
MKIAVTGCLGSVGKRVVTLALKRGHTVLGIDREPAEHIDERADYVYVKLDLTDYSAALDTLKGCDAVVHLAAFRNPGDYGVTTHNNNVVLSWNVLRAAAELGITRVAQASSVNVITMVYSQAPHFHYFPIDEDHPCLPDEPYGLSKVICELQADTLVRRYPSVRIASLRLHWSVPSKLTARSLEADKASKDLWGYVQEDSAAEAFLLALAKENIAWAGHERFFIVAPETAHDEESSKLAKEHWSEVPQRHALVGRQSFFDCGKAERLLGWVHKE